MGRSHERQQGRVNGHEKRLKSTPREDDGYESKLESAPPMCDHSDHNEDRGSSSLDVLPGLGLRELGGVANPHALDERERAPDVTHSVVHKEGGSESGGGEDRCDSALQARFFPALSEHSMALLPYIQ